MFYVSIKEDLEGRAVIIITMAMITYGALHHLLENTVTITYHFKITNKWM